jgi:hypothetical protein
MRVYLPATLPLLAAARDAGWFSGSRDAGPGGLPAHAVTPAVREWYVAGDVEELEYSAMLEAAEASLHLLGKDAAAPRRRVVVAADVPDAVVRPGGGTFRSSVRLQAPVELSAVVSLHVDEAGVADTIATAVAAVEAAAAGDDDAQFLVDEAEACDLLWYDVTELTDLV